MTFILLHGHLNMGYISVVFSLLQLLIFSGTVIRLFLNENQSEWLPVTDDPFTDLQSSDDITVVNQPTSFQLTIQICH